MDMQWSGSMYAKNEVIKKPMKRYEGAEDIMRSNNKHATESGIISSQRAIQTESTVFAGGQSRVSAQGSKSESETCDDDDDDGNERWYVMRAT